MNSVSFHGAIHEFSPITKEAVKKANELAKQGQKVSEYTKFDAAYKGVAEALKDKVAPKAGDNVHMEPIKEALEKQEKQKAQEAAEALKAKIDAETSKAKEAAEVLNAGKAEETYNQFRSF